jgi:hypothetical protein
MKTIDIDLDVYKAIENGRTSFEEGANEILRRLLRIDPARAATGTTTRPRLPRSSGAYSTLIAGHAIEANSLKELLRRVILQSEKLQPGFVDQLALQRTQKGRRIVASSAADLYPRAPQLAEYADRLNAEWWYDTNVGRNQVASYFKLFARLLNLPSIPAISKRSERTDITLEDLGLA